MYTQTLLINSTSALVVIFTVALISGPAMSLVFALPPSNGFKNASDCSNQLGEGVLRTTCCWKHVTEIFSLNTTRCQTCDNSNGTYSNCTDVFTPRNSDSTNPENTGGGVLSDDEGSSESDNTNPKNMGDNVLNDGSANDSSESGGFDPDKVVGGGFNQ